MRVLDEATLNRIISGHDENGYSIVSAFRHDCLGEKPDSVSDEEWDEKVQAENETRTYMLKSILKKLGYSYVPVYGGYKENGTDKESFEKSFIVFPYNIFEDTYTDWDEFEQDMKNIGNDFNQDSVLLKSPDGKPKYYDLKEGHFNDEFTGVSINDVAQQYFTALKRWKNVDDEEEWEGSPQRFAYTFTEAYFEDAPQTIMGAHQRHCAGELVQPYV